ncbi:MAG: vitamin B12-dependent ribonucleotide reductase [Nanoarchaeota archaeon]
MALNIDRYFTEEGKNVYDMFGWKKTDVDIIDDNNVVLFKQKNVEHPSKWSPLAVKMSASKYFYGNQETPKREGSVKQLVGRVSETFGKWAKKQNYFENPLGAEIFKDEIAYLALDQRMAFNSPVWFNVGARREESLDGQQKEAYIINDSGKAELIPIGRENEYPQTSACFILKVGDSMESIMDLAKKEALLFKYGSGTGSNISTLRSSRERLSGGGVPSGPLAYWAFWDKVAGIVKSGGKTRRAAKMDILNVFHPDIMEFITSKRKEEEKLHILTNYGIPFKDAQESVNYQNTNISTRANDEFMYGVEGDLELRTIPVHNKEMADKMPVYKARELLKKIAENAHACGDPGMQYDTTINKWHTCPNSGRINASNPCSEYMFIDDSSCNLASLNLIKFIGGNNEFKIDDFEHAIEITARAQDLEFNNSSFPTKEIAENSYRFRPLGMGYANLGAMLMFLGMPYDSDEGRATAAAVTALLTSRVYETSAEMAGKLGVFEEFEKNKEPMLNVMKMHRDALNNIDWKKLPRGFSGLEERVRKKWDRVIELGEMNGFRNSQASVLAPTGTIGFMMDADTKGAEPEIGLVQIKTMSDGGKLTLVNSTVEPALKRLGYSNEDVESMKKYILEHQTIEGAPGLKEEHLPIFDCALKPSGKGKRTISYQGHLKMMAAIQPFLSGAISKTVNLSKETTVEEIYNIYLDAWKMGLKSVALYRDGSKENQPLSFVKKEKNLEGKFEERPLRKKLPTTRDGKIHKFDISGHEGYMIIGKYLDGTPGELFVTMSKEGSTVGGLMDTIGTLTSLCLQYGVPLEALVNKFKEQKFEPSGIVYEGHPEIKTATSIIDYIFRFLGKAFVPNNKKNNPEKIETLNAEAKYENREKKDEEDKISFSEEEMTESFCAICSSRMVKRGYCMFVCSNKDCGWENPKGCGG